MPIDDDDDDDDDAVLKGHWRQQEKKRNTWVFRMDKFLGPSDFAGPADLEQQKVESDPANNHT
jgi:hypothetical protein